MLTIRNSAEMAVTLASHLDDELMHLLVRHRDRLAEYVDFDLGELAFFVVIDAADTASSIAGVLGFDPTKNRDDDVRIETIGFQPSWEWLVHHDAWTEMAFVLSDDGFGCVLLIPATPGIDPSLAALRRT